MSKPQDYHPQPIDTSRVELPQAVEDLVEQLARNTHDVWAHNRLADGWRWGSERNDEQKEHPCLVPYELLPESEKSIDRAIAIETLKTIIALGFQLVCLDQDESQGKTPQT